MSRFSVSTWQIERQRSGSHRFRQRYNGGMADTISVCLATLATLIVAVIAAVEVVSAVRSGVTGLRGWPDAVRSTGPLWFWLCTSIYVALGTVCFWLGVQGVLEL